MSVRKRCGASQSEGSAFDGSAPFSVLPGTYAVLLHQPEWSVRPAVVSHIELGRTKPDRDIIPGLDFSLLCGERATWKTSNGKESWDAGQVFDQTFVAKGTSITHAAYRLVGMKSPSARLTIHKVEANRPLEQWEQIVPERIDENARTQKDNWVGWRSGEIPTVPGHTFALRIEAWPRGEESGLTLVVHRDSLGSGYDAGGAFAGGVQQGVRHLRNHRL